MSGGVLALLGSGETAPGMTKVHREIFARIPEISAVNLDTAYGFQLNVPQMSEKLEEYFDKSLHVAVTTLHFSTYERSSELERTLFKRQVRQSNYVFAGPGSPTYALKQWSPLHFEEDLLSVLGENGTLCFASAAALTLGAFTAPIYEVYKVGIEEPRWQDGLNLLGRLGLNCVVIPHFDNNEGANYDTRYCYLGEPRLLELEGKLPEGVATLGVDEHTAAILDFNSDTLTVRGRSNAYWRLSGDSKVLANGSTTSLEELRTLTPSVPRTPVAETSELVESPVDLARLASGGGDIGLDALARLVQLASSEGKDLLIPHFSSKVS